MKRSKDEDFILSMSYEDNIDREYTDPIPSPVFTTSLDSNPRTEVKLSFAVEIELPQDTAKLSFGTKISQSVFTPSPSPEKALT